MRGGERDERWLKNVKKILYLLNIFRIIDESTFILLTMWKKHLSEEIKNNNNKETLTIWNVRNNIYYEVMYFNWHNLSILTSDNNCLCIVL